MGAANSSNSSSKPPRTESNAPQQQRPTEVMDLLKSGELRVATPNTLKYLEATNVKSPILSAPKLDGNDPKLQQFIKNTEGLDMGFRRKQWLSEQWKFYLCCEPIQRGFDCGFILGSVAVALGARNPKNRRVGVLVPLFSGGLTIGMISLVVFVSYCNMEDNGDTIRQQDAKLFSEQRAKYSSGNLKKK